MRWPEGALLGGSWAASLALLYNLCDVLFRCGCTWAWAGADRACNVHHESPPHCPWCSHGWAGFLWVPAAILAAETLAIWGLRRKGTPARLLGAAIAFLVTGVAAGLVSALADGYPHFLGFRLR